MRSDTPSRPDLAEGVLAMSINKTGSSARNGDWSSPIRGIAGLFPSPCTALAGLLLGGLLCLSSVDGVAAGKEAFRIDTSGMTGFDVLTSEDGAVSDPGTVVIKYSGPIIATTAVDLGTIWERIDRLGRFERVILRLNSPGGLDTEGSKVIAILSEVRRKISLVTVVAERDLCASMCIAIFIQGDWRYASPASSWMFHGASTVKGGMPNLALTKQHFDLFRSRGIDRRFIDSLFERNYVTVPGAYWMSGSELAAQSNIITKLLPNWVPERPRPRSSSGILRKI